ncbi:MAG: hypothetical protein CTY19_07155 [Methylomonas sp.]|jgi:hypothetical protein|nr:MAG: hypothetical protein CTY19_07155 [Methylomonas sp.]
MATFTAVPGVLEAIKAYLERFKNLPGANAASVIILSSQSLKEGPDETHKLGIYLHRISIDPFGRNRHLPPKPGAGNQPRKELPLNLHVLLIGWSKTMQEQSLLAWAMQVLGSGTELDVADIEDHISGSSSGWQDQDRVQILPEDMSNEDFMRLWDSLSHPYMLSAPYIIKTLRLEPVIELASGVVESIVLPMGELE